MKPRPRVKLRDALADSERRVTWADLEAAPDEWRELNERAQHELLRRAHEAEIDG